MKARIPLTNSQKRAMEAEMKAQMAEYDRKNWEEIDAMVLWVLYSQFGFREKRLRKFYESFAEELRQLIKRYEMSTNDTAWLCARKLKDAGIDISTWSLKED